MALVFVTKEYEGKVNGNGPKGSIDNCYLEFHHIVRQMMSPKMIAVVMDGEMRDPRKWVGALGIGIASRIFVNLIGDGLFSIYTTVLLLLPPQLVSRMKWGYFVSWKGGKGKNVGLCSGSQ